MEILLHPWSQLWSCHPLLYGPPHTTQSQSLSLSLDGLVWGREWNVGRELRHHYPGDPSGEGAILYRKNHMYHLLKLKSKGKNNISQLIRATDLNQGQRCLYLKNTGINGNSVCKCTVHNDIPADAPPFLPEPLFRDISSSSNLYKINHQH